VPVIPLWAVLAYDDALATDAELLDAWQAGDTRAGNTLLERHVEALVRFFGTKAEDALDDLVQRTMLSCVLHHRRLRDSASFRGFLFAIARNELYDHYKRAARDRHKFDPSTSAVTDLAPTPSAALVVGDERQAMTFALRRIPIELQLAIELHYWEELTTAELADALGVPQGTAKSRLRRAKELLRVQLEPDAPRATEDVDRDLDRWAEEVGLRGK
jgi:RNA polymerase sigma factor (sigma-70 family)